jgi:TetR/AcrR family transcriptional regulator
MTKRSRGPRPVTADSPGTRAELLTAAHELMVENDSVDFSLSEIAERAQLSSALVKYYFGSKDGLLMALLGTYKTKPGQLEALLALEAPAATKLAMHIKGIVNVYSRAPYLNRLILTLLSKHSSMAARVSEEFIKPLAGFHRALLAQGVADGSLRPVDPVSFNFILVGACDNLFSRRAALPAAFGISGIDDALKKSHTEQLVGILLSGIGTGVVQQQPAALRAAG